MRIFPIAALLLLTGCGPSSPQEFEMAGRRIYEFGR